MSQQEFFILGDIVTILHPLFEGCEGVITGANNGLMRVDFTDKEDHVDKQVFFNPEYLTLKQKH